MFNRKENKKVAKQKLKQHYIIFVIACLIASFIGASYASSTLAYKAKQDVSINENEVVDNSSVLSDIVNGDTNKGEIDAKQIEANNKSKDEKLGLVSVGYRRGVLASLANTISTGSIFFPSTVTSSPSPIKAPRAALLPLTKTLPDVINLSAARLEHTPHEDMYAFNLIPFAITRSLFYEWFYFLFLQ